MVQLVCRKCEYDMTSLGREVRCPECGTENAAWPAEKLFRAISYGAITKAIWYGYTTAVVAAAAALVASLAAVFVTTALHRLSGGGRLSAAAYDNVSTAADVKGRAGFVLLGLGLFGLLWTLVTPRQRRPRLDWQALLIGLAILLMALSPTTIGR